MRIGIDLGNYSLKAATIWGTTTKYPTLIPDYHLQKPVPTPTLIYLSESGALIGEWTQNADNQLLNTHQIFRHLKEDLGQQQTWAQLWDTESLVALLFRKILFEAKQYAHGANPEGVVITHPFYFNAQQRNSLLNAAHIADLPIIDLISEAQAVALHYGWTQCQAPEKALVLDWGYETLQVTVLELQENQHIQTIAYERWQDLGAKKIIGNLAQQLKGQLQQQEIFTKNNSQTHRQLFKVAEKWLKNFQAQTAEIYWLDFTEQAITFQTQDQLAMPEITAIARQAVESLKVFIERNAFQMKDFQQFFLAGGIFELPFFKDFLQKHLFPAQIPIHCQKPCEAIAKGAAYYASQQKILGNQSYQELENKSRFFIGLRAYDSRQKQNITLPFIRKNDALNLPYMKKVYTRPHQKKLYLEIVQYEQNPEELIGIGVLEINPLPNLSQSYSIEVVFEKKSNGALRVTATNTQFDIFQERIFEEMTQERWEVLSKKRQLVNNTLINDFFTI